MGKKRHPRPTGQKPACWDSNGEASLVGLLDFSLKHKQIIHFNERSVVDLFNDSSHDVYSWDQIKYKLGKIWDDFGIHGTRKKDIYVKGSACLKFPSENEQRCIDSELLRWEDLLKQDEVPVTRRATRESSSASKRGNAHFYGSDTRSPERLTLRTQRHETSELGKQSEIKRELLEDSLPEGETPRKRTKKIKTSQTQNELAQQKKKSSQNLDKGKTRQVRQRSVVEDSELEASSGNDNENSLLASFTLEECNPHDSIPLGLGSKIRQLQGDMDQSPTALERIHTAALQKKDEEITKLKAIVGTYEGEVDDLKNELKTFRIVQETRQEGGDSFHHHMSDLYNQIRDQRIAIDFYLKNGTFTKLAGKYKIGRQEMDMETQVPIIRQTMKKILGGCDDDMILRFPGPNLTAGLFGLLSFGLGLNTQEPFRKEQFESMISSRTPYSIIETLIEAAVCTWVLEYDFPKFAQSLAASGLLAKYRELIAAKDGAVALRNLDLASHYALIHAPAFDTMMDTDAESLAISLSKTLAPFFPRNAKESEDNAFETWSEEKSIWELRRKRLIDIFKSSLKLKAKSVLTPERYELINYPPGTVFDPDTMSVETIDGAPAVVQAGDGYTIEHCLHVAIHAYSREMVRNTDPVSKATIQYSSFTRGDATQSLSTSKPTEVLVKAVVVLRELVDDDAHSEDTVQ